jgi:hypothetical protein
VLSDFAVLSVAVSEAMVIWRRVIEEKAKAKAFLQQALAADDQRIMVCWQSRLCTAPPARPPSATAMAFLSFAVSKR